MFGSLQIGTWFGIPVKLHWSLALLPVITFQFLEVFGWGLWLLFELLIFTSVVVHEFGHALVARRYGVKTYDIVLTPLGGMARMVNMPTSPKQEIAIALAGPLASLGLSGLAFGAVFSLAMLNQVESAPGELFVWIRDINLGLGLFNLAPALPMDGGRVLRGLLALRYDHLSATRKAATVGRIIAVSAAAYGLYNGFTALTLIAVFIYLAAGSEVRMAQWREAQRTQPPAGSMGGPFTYRPRVWTWPRSQPGLESEPPPPVQDWVAPQQPPRNVVIVEGGKAEILGRRDSKD